MDKLRLRFEKTGRAVYISHLDLMRMMQRAFFRAELPLVYSEGFNPHARISVLLPLGIGTASRCELLDFGLREDFSEKDILRRLNDALPEGLRALGVKAPVKKSAELAWVRLEGELREGRDAGFYTRLFETAPLCVQHRTKRGESELSLREHIRSITFEDMGEGVVRCECVLKAQTPSIRPELLIAAMGEDAPGYFRFERTEVYDGDMQPFE